MAHASPRAKLGRAVQATPGAAGSTGGMSVSPLMQLLPLSYQDIQPLQKGVGWHANGKHAAKLKRPRAEVLFPLLPVPHAPSNSSTPGVRDGSARAKGAFNESCEEEEARGPMPPTDQLTLKALKAAPTPPTAPRRPPMEQRSAPGERSGNQSAGSFRSRALMAQSGAGGAGAGAVNGSGGDGVGGAGTSTSMTGQPTVPAVATTEAGPNAAAKPDKDHDAIAMEQLWHEYEERTKPRTLDKEAYHRKMQHKYSEVKALRDKVARLEGEVEDARRQRDEALEQSQQAHHHHHRQHHAMHHHAHGRPNRSADHSSNNNDNEDESDSMLDDGATSTVGGTAYAPGLGPTKSTSQSALGLVLAPVVPLTPDELSYREKCTKLERALSRTKDELAQTQTRLATVERQDTQSLAELAAKLALEHNTNIQLAQQLVETSAAFKTTADELVTTQVTLEQERAQAHLALDELRGQTARTVSDEHRKSLTHRFQNAVRTLGKEALHSKMTSLHTRVLVAEHLMRKAQLEAQELRRQRDLQQLQLERVLSSEALKYHQLDPATEGIPAILAQAQPLYSGTRLISHQYVRLHVLYEESSAPGFKLHFVAYEALTAQDDYLTFQRRDIERLVPDAAKYLARTSHRKQERYLALAELLLESHVQLGYKNNHVVLCERPTPSPLMTDNNNALEVTAATQRVETLVFRSSRLIQNLHDPMAGQLVELTVTEVYDRGLSQLWWLEVQAVDSMSQAEACVRVDLQHLAMLSPHLMACRPSETLERVGTDDIELQLVHEQLLEPVLAELRLDSDEMNQDKDEDANDGPRELPLRLDVALPPSAMLDEPLEPSDAGEQDQVPEMTPSQHPPPPLRRVLSFSAPLASRPETAGSDVLLPSTPLERKKIVSVLDYRCIKHIGEAFFCLRIQEVWDNELMLDIHLDDAESMGKHRRLVREHQLVHMARQLLAERLVTEDWSSQIKFGLPPPLHRPICRALRKCVKPMGTTGIALTPWVTDDDDVDKGNALDNGNNGNKGINNVDGQRRIGGDGSGLLAIRAVVLGGAHTRTVHVVEPKHLAPVDVVAVQTALVQVDENERIVRIERRGLRIRGLRPDPVFAIVSVYADVAGFAGVILSVRSIDATNEAWTVVANGSVSEVLQYLTDNTDVTGGTTRGLATSTSNG